MKKYLSVIGLLVFVSFTSCSTISVINYDYLEAAQVSFPESVRKVGVINNMPLIVGDEQAMSRTAGMLEGDGKVIAEVLAEEVAASNYFDEVVICDSALCDLTISLKNHQALRKDWRGNVLPLNRINEWTGKLGVDMLLSVERVSIELKESADMSNLLGPPVLDGIISVVMRTYAPNRDTSLMTITRRDTIFWEPGPKLTFTQIVRESSEYAAIMLASYILPSWKEASRYYFDGGMVEMRDAGVYVREDNWEEAYPLWKSVYDKKKKGTQKLRAAFNLALYHEMKAEFEQAEDYLNEALQLAVSESVEQAMIVLYHDQLKKSAEKYRSLSLQMQRFE